MKQTLFLALVFLFSLSVFAQTSNLNFERVTVEYHGSWQWVGQQFKEYTFAELKNEDFEIDLDDADERFIVVSYGFGSIVNTYKIDAASAPATQGTDVVFTITKNGKQCAQRTEPLARLSTKVIDFSKECGIKFEAEWETLTFETDVEIHNFELTAEAKNEVKNAFIKNDAYAKQLDSIAKNAKQISSTAGLRVLDISGPEFTVPQGIGVDLRVYDGPPITFNEEDSSGKTKHLIISDRGVIKQVVFLRPDIVFENLIVFKPASQMQVSQFKSPSELFTALNDSSKFTLVNGVDAEDSSVWSEYLGPSAVIGTGAVAAGAGVGIGVSGLTIGALANPFAIVGAAAVFIVGGPTWYFSETDTTRFDETIINWDEELFSRFEQKINFLIYKVGDGAPIPPTDAVIGKVKIPLPQFVQDIKAKFSTRPEESYQLLVDKPLDALVLGLKVYKSNDTGEKLGAPIATAPTVEGESVVLSNLEKGQFYYLEVKIGAPYPSFKTIAGVLRVDEVE